MNSKRFCELDTKVLLIYFNGAHLLFVNSFAAWPFNNFIGGSVFFTLYTGWVINYGSLALCFYTLGGMQIVLQTILLYGIWQGWLDPPPSTEEYNILYAKAHKNEESDHAESGRDPEASDIHTEVDGDEDSTTAVSTTDNSADMTMRESDRTLSARIFSAQFSETFSDKFSKRYYDDLSKNDKATPYDAVCEERSTEGNERADGYKPIAVGAGPIFRKRIEHQYEFLQYHIYYVGMINTFTVAFCGYTTKVLLSTMFVLIFNLPEMTAAYLSALTLLLYLIGRALIPLYLMDRALPSAGLSAIASAFTCLGYVLVPSIIGSKEYESAKFTWNLFGFIVVKSICGASFACLTVCIAPSIMDETGPVNFLISCKSHFLISGLGGAIGLSVIIDHDII